MLAAPPRGGAASTGANRENRPVDTLTPRPGSGSAAAQVRDRGPPYNGGVDEYWVAAAWSIAPTIVIAVLFFWILRSILTFDRTERRVYSEIEAEERAKRARAAENAPPHTS